MRANVTVDPVNLYNALLGVWLKMLVLPAARGGLNKEMKQESLCV